MKGSFADSLKRVVLPPHERVSHDVEIGLEESEALKVVRFEGVPRVMVYVLARHEAGSREWHVEPDAGIGVPLDKVDDLVSALRRAEGTGGQLVERATSLGKPIERVLEAFAAGSITKARARELIEAGIVWGAKDIENGLPDNPLCSTEPYSSRMCELGTKGCKIVHGELARSGR